jgi:carboxylesterase type B
MKKNINVVLLFIICTIPLLCKASDNKIEKVGPDTIILKENVIVFISPSNQKIDSLKKKLGEDNFYTAADDANSYSSDAFEFLDSVKQKFLNQDETKVIEFFDKNNKTIQIVNNDTKASWYAIFYNDIQKKYIIINLLDIKKEYVNFYKNTNKNRENIIEKVKDEMNSKIHP